MVGQINVQSKNRHVFFRMFGFMRPYMTFYLFGVIMFSSQQFVFPLINAVFMNRIVTAIISGETVGVFHAAALFILMSVGAMLIMAPGIYWCVVNEAKAIRALKSKLFRSFIISNTESSGHTHSGGGIASINTDANTASRIYAEALIPFLSCVISILMASLVVFAIDFRLGFASIGVGFLSFFVQSRFAPALGKIGNDQLVYNAETVKKLSDILSGSVTIRAFNMQDSIQENFDTENRKLLSVFNAKALLTTWQNMFGTVQGWLTLCIVFVLGGWLVSLGELEFAALVMAPPMCVSISRSMAGIGSAWANLQPPINAANKVFNILDSAIDLHTEPGEAPIDTEWDGNYTINIKGVNFKYIGMEQDLLKDINLNIHENEFVVFVGESGCGKSTLLRAVSGIFRRSNLNMKIGNILFTDSLIQLWRDKFAFVDQSCKLFDMSIAQNIALGSKKEVNNGQIIEAAKLAFADEFIQELPAGYNTGCGEKGSLLSGGQKQRIAIARALIKGSPVLVFDEVTSALDATSEQKIMESIEFLRSNHTILMITHNLDTVIKADKVVYMHKGGIICVGTHSDLLMECEQYRSFCKKGHKEDLRKAAK